MYRVQLASKAEQFYAVANLPLAKKLAKCFEMLEHNPRNHPNIKPLKGKFAGYYRYRVGDYRVVYYINDEQRIVIVTIIAHRNKVY